MNKQNFARIPVVLAFLAASTSLAWSHDVGQSSRSEQFHAPVSLVGVWRVTRHGVSCATGEQLSTFPALMTFHAGGTLSGDGLSPGPIPVYAPQEHGVWQHGTGSHNFSFKILNYSYDDNGVVDGSQEITATGVFTSANTFTYKASIYFYDTNGELLFSLCGQATGARFF